MAIVGNSYDNKKKVKVAVIGATGYVGIEIVRILQNHPMVEITSVIGQSFVGQKISDVYPNLRGIFDMECISLDIESLPEKADVFINCLPHGISKEFIPLLLEKGKKIIDHGGDFRYKNVEVYEKWYKTKHELPELLKIAVYGLPELYREAIKDAVLVANPGCYPTCSILGLAPLLKNKLIQTDNIIIDAASGITGAGRKTDLQYSFCESTENFKAYGVATHRHTSEIEQELSLLAGKEIMVSFTPHLLPMKRGILATIYANLNSELTANKSSCKGADKATCNGVNCEIKEEAEITTSKLIELYRKFYKNDKFVRILDEGKLPETKNVAGSNFIDIGIVLDKRMNRVIVLSALDNLGKGAASQAIQCLNIMCGFPEETGLMTPGLYL
ncbi:MAG TPA: N-acetyl-gamma-glutamyl-phosphate reductase [Clostridiaceae bacterium]|nr:N-acetyl-gamma-glutamyl-phosphate reductase [Clostridiaceae bacterium]